jgi:hypothetical protein
VSPAYPASAVDAADRLPADHGWTVIAKCLPEDLPGGLV